MPNAKRTLVTAALPYANGPIHIGHLAGVYVPADMYVRYKRLRGDSVLFICGSDEHGVPITISADKEKVSPKVIVERYHELNKKTFEKLGITFDHYGRTSSDEHRKMSQEFFLHLKENGFITAKTEPQLYDQEAKMFLPDRYVEGTCPVCGNTEARGDQCDNCGTYLNQTELINPRSKVTGSKPVVKETEHWYFKLSALQGDLEKFIESKSGIWRETVVQQARSWLKAGLQDRPITRDLEWGVPVPLPNAEGKVLYVWFDAPIGYVTATKELLPDDWQTWWRDDENLEWVCFLGKDNIVFHTIMFPAMELGYNKQGDFKFQLPTQVPANEFMNLEGRKLSKSKGWTIEPHEILQRYDADLIRYTIVCNLPQSKDSDFSWKDFQAHTNNELGNILGNFANRVLTFTERYFDGKVPDISFQSKFEQQLTAPFFIDFKGVVDILKHCYETFELREAVKLTMDLARICNKFINDEEPWKTAKKNLEKTAVTIYHSLEALRALAFYFSPIIPGTSKKIEEMLNYSSKDDRWDNAFEPKLKAGHQLGEVTILFTKIEDMQMDTEIQSLQKMSEQLQKTAASDELARRTERAATEVKPASADGQITIDDFKRIKLKTAVVVEAEPVPKSKKLLKLQIAIGDERRQIVAGIAEKYAPEDLIGKTIVVVANLAPAKLMGIESQGMLLAVNDKKGPVAIVSPISETDSGLEVR